MGIRNILVKGDPTLRKVCRAVESFNERLFILLDDMGDTMAKSNGVGLAAPQVGVLKRVVVVDKSEGEGDLVEMINPLIIYREGEQTGTEGCLSVPGRYGVVTRPMKVRVKFQNRKAEWCEMEAEGLTARAICHECDHLDGKLYTDIASRMLTEEELEELERKKGEA